MDGFNTLYLLLLVPMLLSRGSHSRVRRTYEKFSATPSHKGFSGIEAANQLLAYYGLTGIRIERVAGHLTDHYDPQNNILRLSDGVANGKSVTSLGIVAHEIGHALQDAEKYHFMRLRTFLARRVGPVTQWSSLAFIGGWIFGIPILMVLSGAILAAMVIFSLVTLPVERDASVRALKSLQQTGLAVDHERASVEQVLHAAALTYLTGVAQRLGSFLFYVLMIAVAQGFLQLPGG